MASGIEYTQVIQTAGFTSGDPDYQYFQLGVGTPPPAGSIFVIKYMTLVSSGDIASGSPALSLVSSSDDIGTQQYIFFNTPNGFGSNTPQPICVTYGSQNQYIQNQLKDVIINQPYIGIFANADPSATITLLISYLVIPSTNPLYLNFGVSAASNQTGELVVLPSSTSSRLVKSIIYTSQASATTVTPYYFQASPSLSTPLVNEISVASYATVQFYPPVYLAANTGDTLKINQMLNGTYYVSYIQDVTV